MRTRFGVIVFLAALCLVCPWGVRTAHADAVVTLCQDDQQAGAGVNLTAAIAGGGKVTFNCGGPATIRITAQHIVAQDLSIDGGNTITLDAATGSASALTTAPHINLTLTGLTFTRSGGGAGGNIVQADRSQVWIIKSTFSGTWSPVVTQYGTLTIEDSHFLGGTGTAIRATDVSLMRTRIENVGGNALDSINGAAVITDSDIIGSGPVVISGGKLTVVRSRFTNNTDHGLGGGGLHLDADAAIRNSVFTGNQGTDGGAIHIGGAAHAITIDATRFIGNVASRSGGAIAVGALTAPARTLTINHGLFQKNTAPTGGAIDLGEAIENDGALAGVANTFAGNAASGDGGAIAGTNVALQLSQAVFIGNTAGGHGGAIRLQLFAPRPSQIANALIVRNTAPDGGGFVGAGMEFINSTIAGNSGGGVVQVAATPAAWRSIRLRNTILSGNTGGNCASTSPLLALTDEGNNLQFPGATCPGTIPSADPWLDTLYIPVPGSPAFGHGDNATCAATPVNGRDVYGQPRPQGPVCAVGAVEGDLEKQIADGTTGGPGWPGGLGGIGGKPSGPGGSGGGGSGSGGSGPGGSGGGGSGGGGGTGGGPFCGCDCLPICWWRPHRN